MKNFFLIILIFFSIFFLTSPKPISAAVYYVDPSGNGDFLTIQSAADNIGPGDSCIVREGNYDERIEINTSGETDNVIRYEADNGAEVATWGFEVSADFIEIKGFQITLEISPSDTCCTSDASTGIWVNGNNCLIENNYLYYNPFNGITTSEDSTDCVIRNNRCHRNGMSGLTIHGSNHLIENNEIWETIQYHPSWENDPGYLDADGMRFFGSNHVFKKNYIHDISFSDPLNIDPHIDCFQTWSDTWHDAGHDITFEQNFCEVLEKQSTEENGIGFMLNNADNLIIKNNIIKSFVGVHTSSGGGNNSNLTIVNNLFAGDLQFADNYPSGESAWPAGIFLYYVDGVIAKNNIFYEQGRNSIQRTGANTNHDIGYNLAFRSDGGDPWGTSYPDDSYNDIEGDPLFVNPEEDDYRLQPDSPAIDAGTDILEVTNDYQDISRPQGAGYDIGPFEYSSELICNDLEFNADQPINPGEQIELRCLGSGDPIDHYNYQYRIEPDGDWQNLGSGTSIIWQIPSDSSGKNYRFECQVCLSADNSVCSPWSEQVLGISNSQTKAFQLQSVWLAIFFTGTAVSAIIILKQNNKLVFFIILVVFTVIGILTIIFLRRKKTTLPEAYPIHNLDNCVVTVEIPECLQKGEVGYF